MKKAILGAIFLLGCRADYDAEFTATDESDESDSSSVGTDDCGSACETGGSTSTSGTTDSDSTGTTGDGDGDGDGDTDSTSEETGEETGDPEPKKEGDICDPFMMECDVGLDCFRSAVPDMFGKFFFECLPPTGNAGLQDECQTWSDCTGGLHCAAVINLPDGWCQGAACCTPYCYPNGPMCPNGFGSCTLFEDQWVDEMSFSELGWCEK